MPAFPVVLLLSVAAVAIVGEETGPAEAGRAARPKLDPTGIFLISLGKKRAAPTMYSPHVSAGVLTNLRKFFDELKEDLETSVFLEHEESDDAMNEEVRQRSPPTVRFVTRSKSAGPRKVPMNPSLLWTGLGRK